MTDRVLAERALAASEKRLRHLMRAVPVGIQECGATSIITFVSESYERMMGFRRGGGVGRGVWEMLADPEEAQGLRELRPDLPIVLCTGHSRTIDEVHARQLGVDELLLKPVSRAALGAVVQRALAGEGREGEGVLREAVGPPRCGACLYGLAAGADSSASDRTWMPSRIM